jgi:hypothetical protein
MIMANNIKPSPLHDDLTQAGYNHDATHTYNGNANHVYSGQGGYGPVLKKHGFGKITDTVYKHPNGDSVQLKPADEGHKPVHRHHDSSYKYPTNEGDPIPMPSEQLGYHTDNKGNLRHGDQVMLNEDEEYQPGDYATELIEKEMGLTPDLAAKVKTLFEEATSQKALMLMEAFAGEVLNCRAANEYLMNHQDKIVEWVESQLEESERKIETIDELSILIAELANEVFGSGDKVDDFLARVAAAVDTHVASAASDGRTWSSGVDDSAHAKNTASVRGRDVAPTNSRGDHAGIVKESVNPTVAALVRHADMRMLVEDDRKN